MKVIVSSSINQMALTSRVSVPDLEGTPEAEDIFAIHLAYLFTDHIPNAHGNPGAFVVYKSPLFGDISLQIPKHPDIDTDRQLFAHYLWNAAVIAAEGIESASADEEATKFRTDQKASPWQEYQWDRKYWDMRGADVLELGAGTALPSIISYLSGARSLTTTDHPSSTAITTNTITTNIAQNINKTKIKTSPTPPPITTTTPTPIDAPNEPNEEQIELPATIKVYGYLWGETEFHSPPPSPIDDQNSLKLKRTNQPPKLRSFTKIIVADCLWIRSRHSAICKTILDYLQDTPDRRDRATTASSAVQPCALVIAGFHTGREITSEFFDIATGMHPCTGDSERDDSLTIEVRGQLRIAEIFEVDTDGRRREWMASRPGEMRDDTKRWCVCAALVRR